MLLLSRKRTLHRCLRGEKLSEILKMVGTGSMMFYLISSILLISPCVDLTVDVIESWGWVNGGKDAKTGYMSWHLRTTEHPSHQLHDIQQLFFELAEQKTTRSTPRIARITRIFPN